MISANTQKRGHQLRRSEEVAEVLFLTLFRRGLLAAQVPRFLKDVLNIVEDAGKIPASAVNQKLARLGWSEEILDERTLELILYLYEGSARSVPLDVLQATQAGQEVRPSLQVL